MRRDCLLGLMIGHGVELDVFTPYKLVSLLDMLKFYATVYLEIASSLATASGLIKGTSIFLKTLDKAGINKTDVLTLDLAKNKQVSKNLIKDLRKTSRLCKKIHLTLSAKQCDRLIKLATKDVSLDEWESTIDELINRIKDEMSEIHFFRIHNENIVYFEQPNIFGDKVFSSFPSSNYDIGEAGKTFALARYTACVFHLMRSMETPLQLLASELEIDYSANWNKYLEQVDKIAKEIREGKRPKPTDWSDREQFYNEASGMLRNVKNAWRNEVMRLDSKYTDEEALRILEAVKGFMQFLAENLKEEISQ